MITQRQRNSSEKESVSLEEGITRMAEWAKASGSRQSKKFENIEILENLPDPWPEDFKKVVAEGIVGNETFQNTISEFSSKSSHKPSTSGGNIE